ncbi:DUF6088 family protein [Hyphomicrobium sp.]|uniref:DUF6088 family protein n=1 Tax=Hyphomicrobium sp. TaxID=82 RepID=UPI0039E4E61B
MTGINHKILKIVRGSGRGNNVYSAKDFLHLASRASIDQALSRLAKAGKLRRVGRGLYDLPRSNPLLKRPSPAKTSAVVDAVARRHGLKIAPDNIAAANGLGLTNAVPARPVYVTDGPSRSIAIDGGKIRLNRASTYLRPWLGSPGQHIVQTLLWLGKDLGSSPDTIAALRARLPKKVKRDLAQKKAYLPDWAIRVVNAVIADAEEGVRTVPSPKR